MRVTLRVSSRSDFDRVFEASLLRRAVFLDISAVVAVVGSRIRSAISYAYSRVPSLLAVEVPKSTCDRGRRPLRRPSGVPRLPLELERRQRLPLPVLDSLRAEGVQEVLRCVTSDSVGMNASTMAPSCLIAARPRKRSARGEVFSSRIEWRPAGTETPLVIDLPALFEDALG